MGKNPSVIIREQAAKAKRRLEKIRDSHSPGGILYEESQKNNCYCGYYNDLLKAFMIEGYSQKKAEKHINEWVDNDFLWIGTRGGYEIVGYGDF